MIAPECYLNWVNNIASILVYIMSWLPICDKELCKSAFLDILPSATKICPVWFLIPITMFCSDNIEELNELCSSGVHDLVYYPGALSWSQVIATLQGSMATWSSDELQWLHSNDRVPVLWQPGDIPIMMTSSNGNIYRVTGHLCGEFTGHRWIPRTKASDGGLLRLLIRDANALIITSL